VERTPSDKLSLAKVFWGQPTIRGVRKQKKKRRKKNLPMGVGQGEDNEPAGRATAQQGKKNIQETSSIGGGGGRKAALVKGELEPRFVKGNLWERRGGTERSERQSMVDLKEKKRELMSDNFLKEQ